MRYNEEKNHQKEATNYVYELPESAIFAYCVLTICLDMAMSDVNEV